MATQKKAAAQQKATKAAAGTKGTKVQEVQSKSLAVVNKTTAVAIKQNVAAMFEQDAGVGNDFDRNDLSIPRIGLLQSNSPQVKKGDGKFIKGAEAGDFLDSVTNEVFAKGDSGFLFIPVAYRRTDIEWIPRTKGGGFIQDHGLNSGILNQCTKDDNTGAMLLKNGNEIVTTAEYIGYAIGEDGIPRQVAISLAKTGLRVSRQVNTRISTLMVPRPNGQGSFNPAMFYSYFKVTSTPAVSKKTNDSYMAWAFAREGNTVDLDGGAELYMEARGFRESVDAGKVKVAQGDQDEQGVSESDDSSL